MYLSRLMADSVNRETPSARPEKRLYRIIALQNNAGFSSIVASLNIIYNGWSTIPTVKSDMARLNSNTPEALSRKEVSLMAAMKKAFPTVAASENKMFKTQFIISSSERSATSFGG